MGRGTFLGCRWRDDDQPSSWVAPELFGAAHLPIINSTPEIGRRAEGAETPSISRLTVSNKLVVIYVCFVAEGRSFASRGLITLLLHTKRSRIQSLRTYSAKLANHQHSLDEPSTQTNT